MSILNDDRRFGSDEERSEWQQEVNYEYRKEQYNDEEENEYDRRTIHALSRGCGF